MRFLAIVRRGPTARIVAERAALKHRRVMLFLEGMTAGTHSTGSVMSPLIERLVRTQRTVVAEHLLSGNQSSPRVAVSRHSSPRGVAPIHAATPSIMNAMKAFTASTERILRTAVRGRLRPDNHNSPRGAVSRHSSPRGVAPIRAGTPSIMNVMKALTVSTEPILRTVVWGQRLLVQSKKRPALPRLKAVETTLVLTPLTISVTKASSVPWGPIALIARSHGTVSPIIRPQFCRRNRRGLSRTRRMCGTKRGGRLSSRYGHNLLSEGSKAQIKKDNRPGLGQSCQSSDFSGLCVARGPAIGGSVGSAVSLGVLDVATAPQEKAVITSSVVAVAVATKYAVYAYRAYRLAQRLILVGVVRMLNSAGYLFKSAYERMAPDRPCARQLGRQWSEHLKWCFRRECVGQLL